MAREINSLKSLLYEQLKDMYDMEKQLTKALPKMAKSASSDELRTAIEEHLEVTNNQVARLEQVFELLGESAKSKTCNGMKGLIEEGKEAIEEDAEEPFGDAAIIAAAQRVEHYEMAAYGCARTFAEVLGNSQAVELLQETLDEEKEADEKLTEICQSLLEGHAGEEEQEEGEEMMDSEEEEMDTERKRPVRMASSGQSRKSGESIRTRRRAV